MADFKPVAANRKAFHDYEILEKIEAGISMTGNSIKTKRDSSKIKTYENQRNIKVNIYD
jgi:tmRNA-binding protein